MAQTRCASAPARRPGDVGAQPGSRGAAKGGIESPLAVKGRALRQSEDGCAGVRLEQQVAASCAIMQPAARPNRNQPPPDPSLAQLPCRPTLAPIRTRPDAPPPVLPPSNRACREPAPAGPASRAAPKPAARAPRSALPPRPSSGGPAPQGLRFQPAPVPYHQRLRDLLDGCKPGAVGGPDLDLHQQPPRPPQAPAPAPRLPARDQRRVSSGYPSQAGMGQPPAAAAQPAAMPVVQGVSVGLHPAEARADRPLPAGGAAGAAPAYRLSEEDGGLSDAAQEELYRLRWQERLQAYCRASCEETLATATAAGVELDVQQPGPWGEGQPSEGQGQQEEFWEWLFQEKSEPESPYGSDVLRALLSGISPKFAVKRPEGYVPVTPSDISSSRYVRSGVWGWSCPESPALLDGGAAAAAAAALQRTTSHPGELSSASVAPGAAGSPFHTHYHNHHHPGGQQPPLPAVITPGGRSPDHPHKRLGRRAVAALAAISGCPSPARPLQPPYYSYYVSHGGSPAHPASARASRALSAGLVEVASSRIGFPAGARMPDPSAGGGSPVTPVAPVAGASDVGPGGVIGRQGGPAGQSGAAEAEGRVVPFPPEYSAVAVRSSGAPAVAALAAVAVAPAALQRSGSWGGAAVAGQTAQLPLPCLPPQAQQEQLQPLSQQAAQQSQELQQQRRRPRSASDGTASGRPVRTPGNCFPAAPGGHSADVLSPPPKPAGAHVAPPGHDSDPLSGETNGCGAPRLPQQAPQQTDRGSGGSQGASQDLAAPGKSRFFHQASAALVAQQPLPGQSQAQDQGQGWDEAGQASAAPPGRPRVRSASAAERPGSTGGVNLTRLSDLERELEPPQPERRLSQQSRQQRPPVGPAGDPADRFTQYLLTSSPGSSRAASPSVRVASGLVDQATSPLCGVGLGGQGGAGTASPGQEPHQIGQQQPPPTLLPSGCSSQGGRSPATPMRMRARSHSAGPCPSSSSSSPAAAGTGSSPFSALAAPALHTPPSSGPRRSPPVVVPLTWEPPPLPMSSERRPYERRTYSGGSTPSCPCSPSGNPASAAAAAAATAGYAARRPGAAVRVGGVGESTAADLAVLLLDDTLEGRHRRRLERRGPPASSSGAGRGDGLDQPEATLGGAAAHRARSTATKVADAMPLASPSGISLRPLSAASCGSSTADPAAAVSPVDTADACAVPTLLRPPRGSAGAQCPAAAAAAAGTWADRRRDPVVAAPAEGREPVRGAGHHREGPGGAGRRRWTLPAEGALDGVQPSLSSGGAAPQPPAAQAQQQQQQQPAKQQPAPAAAAAPRVQQAEAMVSPARPPSRPGAAGHHSHVAAGRHPHPASPRGRQHGAPLGSPALRHLQQPRSPKVRHKPAVGSPSAAAARHQPQPDSPGPAPASPFRRCGSGHRDSRGGRGGRRPRWDDSPRAKKKGCAAGGGGGSSGGPEGENGDAASGGGSGGAVRAAVPVREVSRQQSQQHMTGHVPASAALQTEATSPFLTPRHQPSSSESSAGAAGPGAGPGSTAPSRGTTTASTASSVPTAPAPASSITASTAGHASGRDGPPRSSCASSSSSSLSSSSSTAAAQPRPANPHRGSGGGAGGLPSATALASSADSWGTQASEAHRVASSVPTRADAAVADASRTDGHQRPVAAVARAAPHPAPAAAPGGADGACGSDGVRRNLLLSFGHAGAAAAAVAAAVAAASSAAVAPSASLSSRGASRPGTADAPSSPMARSRPQASPRRRRQWDRGTADVPAAPPKRPQHQHQHQHQGPDVGTSGPLPRHQPPGGADCEGARKGEQAGRGDLPAGDTVPSPEHKDQDRRGGQGRAAHRPAGTPVRVGVGAAAGPPPGQSRSRKDVVGASSSSSSSSSGGPASSSSSASSRTSSASLAAAAAAVAAAAAEAEAAAAEAEAAEVEATAELTLYAPKPPLPPPRDGSVARRRSSSSSWSSAGVGSTDAPPLPPSFPSQPAPSDRRAHAPAGALPPPGQRPPRSGAPPPPPPPPAASGAAASTTGVPSGAQRSRSEVVGGAAAAAAATIRTQLRDNCTGGRSVTPGGRVRPLSGASCDSYDSAGSLTPPGDGSTSGSASGQHHHWSYQRNRERALVLSGVLAAAASAAVPGHGSVGSPSTARTPV